MTLPSFDDLKQLFECDPIAFDTLRKDLIETEINNTHSANRRRLRGIQFQINSIRQTSKNPLDCCVKIQRMLDEKLDELSSVFRDNRKTWVKHSNSNNIVFLPERDET